LIESDLRSVGPIEIGVVVLYIRHTAPQYLSWIQRKLKAASTYSKGRDDGRMTSSVSSTYGLLSQNPSSAVRLRRTGWLTETSSATSSRWHRTSSEPRRVPA
jgi:hypothetical protein